MFIHSVYPNPPDQQSPENTLENALTRGRFSGRRNAALHMNPFVVALGVFWAVAFVVAMADRIRGRTAFSRGQARPAPILTSRFGIRWSRVANTVPAAYLTLPLGILLLTAWPALALAELTWKMFRPSHRRRVW